MARITYPECGKIINTHGCRGTVKIEPWCDSPAAFAALPRVFVKNGEAYVPVRLRRVSVGGRFVLADLDGVDTMDKADAMRGTVLYAHRDDLKIPEGVFLVAELIGLPVFDATSGAQLGTLSDIIHPGATDIYVIRTPKGEAMVPVVDEFVSRVSEEGIFLTPIEGMFEP